VLLESLLAETFGVPVSDPRVQRVMQVVVLDHRAMVRRQIQADPCRDYKVVMRRYHVSHQTVYHAWREILTTP
jgi:hypothetical protein